MEVPSPSSGHWIQSYASFPPPSRPRSTPQTDIKVAFLVHSQDSISTNTGPDIDDKSLVRQRRRRTSPEDQSILEEEFEINDKPDREARKKICQRVSLGDKEVHIWFQNRRQKTRRKGGSLPDDGYLLSRSFHESSSFEELDSSGSFDYLPEPRALKASDTPPSSSEVDLGHAFAVGGLDGTNESRPVPTTMVAPTPRQHAHQEVPDAITLGDAPTVAPKRPTDDCALTRQEDTTSPADIVASNDSAIRLAQTSQDPSCSKPCVNAGTPTQITSKPTSSVASEPQKSKAIAAIPSLSKSVAPAVRLSLTSTGGACLLAASETTPSPPKAHVTAPTPWGTRHSLRRSYSAAGLSDFRSDVRSTNSTPALKSSSQQERRADEPIQTAPLLQRQSTGRSQDSRTWEFWCDSSARSELARTAETQMDGNARHALGLIRSRSQHGSQNSKLRAGGLARSNSCRSYTEHSSKRQKMEATERVAAEAVAAEAVAPVERAATAGRAKSSKQHNKHLGLGIFEDSTATPGSPERILRSPAGDSDKENHGPQIRRQHVTHKEKPQRRRPVLVESQTTPPLGRARSALSNVGTNVRSERHARSAKDGAADPEADEELSRFMRAGRDEDVEGTREGDEEDELAVQGLLSLSQGNWR